ncbi:hypothetical protein Scep_026065 [Stephania cephalantha]|uniref:Uncharacterized protein n=1 Tax=Stephania cephalantha TaxID=152367 RepID=A0AAP0EJE9_9MAGN
MRYMKVEAEIVQIEADDVPVAISNEVSKSQISMLVIGASSGGSFTRLNVLGLRPIYPESQSFNDHELGPIPKKWRGSCQNDTKKGVPCNRKLIRAKYFNAGYEAYAKEMNYSVTVEISARDEDGHGTHTLSA